MPTEKLNVLRVATALAEVARLTDGTIPLHTLIALLVISSRGRTGATLKEVETYLPMVPPSALHRSLQRLGDGASDEVKNVGTGLGLVERFPDPVETRRLRYRAKPLAYEVLEKAGWAAL